MSPVKYEQGFLYQKNTFFVVTAVRNIGQGEARNRKYKRLKLGGGHVYDRSGV
jgi:hypothetical protein